MSGLDSDAPVEVIRAGSAGGNELPETVAYPNDRPKVAGEVNDG